MTESLWAMPDPGTTATVDLPDVALRVVAAVRANAAPAMFPPVAAEGPDGALFTVRHLRGDADARRLVHALADARFAPLVDLLIEVDQWCAGAGRRYASVVAPDVLDVVNGDLFGPVVTEVFVACAAGRAGFARRFAAEQGRCWTDLLSLFLQRLQRDLEAHWPADPAMHSPVVALWAHGAETHNGRQRVLRLTLAGGASVAYKPRPVSGEALFLATGTAERPGSVFDLLNRLPEAAGPVRLPVLRCWTGNSDEYAWQEWVARPSQWATIRQDGHYELRGTRLTAGQANRYWQRAGSLAAACFAFGVSDLQEGNLLVGQRPGDEEPLPYPIDMEVYFGVMPRLYGTGLIQHIESGHHHVGLESVARWCALEGPSEIWREDAAGALLLHHRDQPFGRLTTRTVVVDTEGRAGYGPYLPAMLRGMFDAWTLMCQQRGRLTEFVAAASVGRNVRVLRQPTSVYYEALVGRLHSGGGAAPVPRDAAVRFDHAELAQLRRMDVPYFFRAADGSADDGPLRFVRQAHPSVIDQVTPRGEPEVPWPPIAAVRQGDRLTLAGLGVALRDAVEYVFDGVPEHVLVDAPLGVCLVLDGPRRGEVAFDWRSAGRRVIYEWDETSIRLRVTPLADIEPDVARGIRDRLLRLDQLDAPLRQRWVDSGFTDSVARGHLTTLTDTGLTWLADVVRERGWPTRSAIGDDATEAASRLLQHTEGHLAFRRECLALVRVAAAYGEFPWREVAYLTDAVLLAEGNPQRYGTKFERVDTGLVPCPLESSAHVDEWRARLGLDPLRAYAERLRARFDVSAAS